MASAIEHRMDGLLHSEVRSHRLAMPAELTERLATDDLLRQRRTASLWAAHDRVMSAARAVGTDIATFKGPSAELRWYDRRGERPCVDLDAWIRPGPVEGFVALVEHLDPQHALLTANLGELAHAGRLQSVEVALGGVVVDLHLDPLKLGVPSRIETELWERTMLLERSDGPPVRVLDASSALLQLLVHLNKDRFRQLLGLADIARLIDRSAPDLDDLCRLARQGGLEVPVIETLRACLDELERPQRTFDQATGVRPLVWRATWRRGIRLRGAEGITRFRHRQALIPVLLRGPGRGRDAVRRYLHLLLPPRALVEYRNPDVRGGYVRKLLVGRAKRLAHRPSATSLEPRL